LIVAGNEDALAHGSLLGPMIVTPSRRH